MLCLYKVWTWLKKYWKWLLFPVGIVVGIIGMLGSRKSLGDVVSPEAVKAEEERLKHEAEAREQEEAADKIRREKLEFIEREHAETLKDLTDDQKDKVDELREDPDKLNEFLLGVGKDIRG